VQRTDVQRPRTEADQEWDDTVDEAAYEGATAYSPTSYAYSDWYAARGRTTAAATDRAAATHRENRRRRFESVRERMTFGDWTQEEWDQMEQKEHDPPISVSSISSSSLPSLVSVSPPMQHRNPSPPPSSPPSPEPIQLQYVTDGAAGPVYALQLGPSLRHQPLQQRLVLADQLREALISPEEELMLDDHNRRYGRNHLRYPGRTVSSPSRQTVSLPSPSPLPPPPPPPPPPPQTAVASTQFCSFWSAGRRGCRRRRSTE
jgi:hypothetical protein